MTNIYVGNIPHSLTESQLKEVFEGAGPVESVKIIIDAITGKSRGFAFIRMNKEHALQAIDQFNNYELMGRPLRVSEANRQQRPGFNGNRDRTDRGNRNERGFNRGGFGDRNNRSRYNSQY
jgi:RNA recognition motif-containing protein